MARQGRGAPEGRGRGGRGGGRGRAGSGRGSGRGNSSSSGRGSSPAFVANATIATPQGNGWRRSGGREGSADGGRGPGRGGGRGGGRGRGAGRGASPRGRSPAGADVTAVADSKASTAPTHPLQGRGAGRAGRGGVQPPQGRDAAADRSSLRDAKRQKVRHSEPAGEGEGRVVSQEGGQERQQQQQQRKERRQHQAVADVHDVGKTAADGGAADATVTQATAAAAAATIGAVTGEGAAATAKKVAVTAPRVANANWDALKTVAAARRPPPSEEEQERRHRFKRRRQGAAASGEAAGADAGAAAASGSAGGGGGGSGRRPGMVGSDTGLTRVLALDCEMVGVGPGGKQSALARVCLVNSSGAVLMDTFVQPNEKVTDYRTWVSGVRPSDLVNARPYDSVVLEVGELVKGRVLVGHAIGHDLRALRLEEHPRSLLRDTSKFPLLMKELPGGRKVSTSLKDLASTHLGLTIQEGEHSPVDDARAALYLYQKYHREWEADVKAGILTPVSGMGRKAGGTKEQRAKKGVKGRVAGGKRGAALRDVAEGGTVKKLRGAAKARALKKSTSGAKAGNAVGGPGGIWSLATDPYADL